MFPIFIAEVFVTDLTMPISDVSCFFDGLYLAVDLGQLMAGCRKISDLFGIRIGLTVEFNSCRINGDTIFRASWFFFYSGSYACFFAFLMVLIIVAGKGYGAALSIL